MATQNQQLRDVTAEVLALAGQLRNGDDTRSREHETASGSSHFGMMICREMEETAGVARR